MDAQIQTAQPAIPFKRDSASGASPVAAGGVGVLIVSLLAIAAVLVIRKKLRLGQPASGRAALLQVLETQRLGPRALLSVVQFSGTHYLLAQGEHGISCIATSPAENPAKEAP